LRGIMADSSRIIAAMKRVVAKIAPYAFVVARIVAVLLAVYWFIHSVRLVKAGWGMCFPDHFNCKDPKIEQAIAWSVWTIATPMWFLFEYTLFNLAYPNPPKELLEKFKYNQDLAGKLWLAVAAVLLALYFGRDMKH
jgi:hypothetical protein